MSWRITRAWYLVPYKYATQPAAAACRLTSQQSCLNLAQSPNGFDKTGPYRARFILEALHDLRNRLRDAGSDLLVRIGKPGGRA